MTTRTETINGRAVTAITADEGKEFIRTADGLRMGSEIYLGIDYSTGEPREDKPEYYDEAEKEYPDVPEDKTMVKQDLTANETE